ncbi:MAG: TonB-dependent receptor [Microscillaceae bacterium]|nr:TonB-dependent receptor [Microscillaceae bacterium]
MRIITIYINLTLFCSLGVFDKSLAQTGSLSGRISSQEGKPLEFVTIALKNTTLGSSSNAAGNFEISDIPFGSYEVVASLLGYESQVSQITLSPYRPNLSLNFELQEVSSGLDEIVISGTMMEVSKLESAVPVEVYSPKFFRANPSPSIFESLQNVNGVRPQLNCNVCNTGDIHINGLEGPYTMVMIDGMPIVSGLSTVYGLTGIPQSLIERVEIVKGPASTLYGSEAVGGLINIITKKPANSPLLSADVLATGWGEVNTDLGVKYKLGSKIQSLLGINYFNYQNPIDHNGDGFTDVTLQNRISFFNKISTQRKNQRVFTLAGRYVYEDRWGGELGWSKEFRGGDEVYGESIYTGRWEVFGVYQLPVKETINFQFSANGHRQNSVYGNTLYLADQYIGFGQLTWNKTVGIKHHLLSGIAYRYTYYDDNTPATAGFDTLGALANKPSVKHLPGVFIQDEVSFNTQHKLLFGLRYDYDTDHGNIFSPRLNYKWSSANKRNVLRFSLGNGFRVANVFTEDHAALTGARRVVFAETLKPETSWNANINYVKQIFTKNNTFIGLDASVFYTYFNNRIIPDYEANPNQIIYANLDGSAISRGVSLNMDIAWENGLKILGGFTAMDVTFEENGLRVRQLLTERFSGVWSIGYTFPKLGLTLDYTGNLYGPMRLPLLSDLDSRPEYSPWWSIQNIQVTKSFKKGWELYGGIKNLLNYTPPKNSIARAFDPFDRQVQFDGKGQVIPTADNPQALTFDPSYVFAPNQGIRLFLGLRYTL